MLLRAWCISVSLPTLGFDGRDSLPRWTFVLIERRWSHGPHSRDPHRAQRSKQTCRTLPSLEASCGSLCCSMLGRVLPLLGAREREAQVRKTLRRHRRLSSLSCSSLTFSLLEYLLTVYNFPLDLAYAGQAFLPLVLRPLVLNSCSPFCSSFSSVRHAYLPLPAKLC